MCTYLAVVEAAHGAVHDGLAGQALADDSSSTKHIRYSQQNRNEIKNTKLVWQWLYREMSSQLLYAVCIAHETVKMPSHSVSHQSSLPVLLSKVILLVPFY